MEVAIGALPNIIAKLGELLIGEYNLQKKVKGEIRYLIVVDDIWDIPAWEMIRCALPDNDVGYTIITTTRISDIAEQAGGAYKLKPLSFNNSRKLLYRRIFGNENHDHDEGTEKYPDDELAEISDKILKKCAGVPLAIITMASLLACKARNKMEWYEVYNSIGTGLKNNLDVKNMRKILSFSYYELPCHLKTCLLYLSVFPEDFEIEKDRLIKMWIAEGFIQCRIQAKSLFELGESYLNEIINRSMIQPICNETDGMMYTCRVHDMVLDLIRSLSSEENFAVIRSDMDPSQSNTIRRLSLQNGMENDIMAHTTISLQQARSVVVFPPVVSLAPALGSCRILRVMDLEGCNVSKYTSSLNKYIRSLRQLRYLGLRRTHIDHLPEEIGNLKFLQTLDARGNEISSLPSGIVQLRNLIFLHIDLSTRVPNGIGNLRGLEQLSWLDIDGSNVNIVEDLRQLTEMRRLWIRFDEWNDKLLECLRKLEKIQELLVMVRPGHRSIGGLDTWVAPRHLRELSTQNGTWFSVLPAWVSPWLLTDLSHLFIAVKELHQSDLEILGKLPVLCCLSLEVDNLKLEILGGFVVGAGLFPCLVHCEFLHFVWPVIFQQGAMPRLRDLKLEPIHVGEARQITNRVGGLDLGLGYLPSLQSVLAYFLYESASKKEAEEAEAVLLHAAETHPNDPRHCVYIFDKSTKVP
ncbi:hypothetical protein HU200_044082 [Digitaria exilis]|uniref:NB-ARC domain-containing protein n=1 Tax=Digitaria exilis TaxID=1010633 RepID=A0A835EFR6_9POAL|nr:hypothetical protein HU200_044082 [Digitaria exilis]